MLTLAQITRETRMLLKISAAIGIIFLLVFTGIKSSQFIQNVFFPPPPAPPEEKFGKLPDVIFPASQGSTPIEYNINTVEGQLPVLPDRMSVFKINSPTANILALQDAEKKMTNLGFTGDETKLTDTLYQWTNPDIGTTIQYDIINTNFDISSQYLSQEQGVGISNSLDDFKGIVSEFVRILGVDLSDADLKLAQTQYLKKQGTELIKADKSFDAQFVRVDITQNDMNIKPFVLNQEEVKTMKVRYPDPKGSTMYFILGVQKQRIQILEAHFIHQIINKDEKTDYPIKSALQMYEDLKSGKAYILNNSTTPKIDIISITPSYYVGREPQQFLIPVLVFSGENFTAYVPAIAASSIGQ